MVWDSYYGPVWQEPFEAFRRSLNSRNGLKRTFPVYRVKSLDHAREVLERPELHYREGQDYICFRGQTRQHSVRRPFANPLYSNTAGEETLLLPGYWRQYRDSSGHVSNERPMAPTANFLDILGDHLFYWGIDVDALEQKIYDRYGWHHMSDLEDFPDPDIQEYADRYNQKLRSQPELILLGQHYGIQTPGLDVTFDFKVALFFATHRFAPRENGKSTYVPLTSEHGGAVYLLRFRSPSLRKSSDQISTIDIFQHILPVRPLRQSCALPVFPSYYVNEAAARIVAKLEIDSDFSGVGLPRPEELFPSKEEDPFYRALLDLKSRYPEELESVPDYDFQK